MTTTSSSLRLGRPRKTSVLQGVKIVIDEESSTMSAGMQSAGLTLGPEEPRPAGAKNWGLARSKLKRGGLLKAEAAEAQSVSLNVAQAFIAQNKKAVTESQKKRMKYESCAEMLRLTKPGERTEAQILQMRRLLAKGNLSGVGEKVMKDICQRLEFKEYKPQTCLFKQDEIATEFFIILRGQVGLYVSEGLDPLSPDSPPTSPGGGSTVRASLLKRRSLDFSGADADAIVSPTSPASGKKSARFTKVSSQTILVDDAGPSPTSPTGRKSIYDRSLSSRPSKIEEVDELGDTAYQAGNRIKVLMPGEQFGERGLLTGEKRTATARVVGVEPVAVGSLSKDNFDKYARQALSRGRTEKLDFLRMFVPLFKNAEETSLEHLSYVSYESSHVRGEVLDKWLEPGVVAFVIEGQVDVHALEPQADTQPEKNSELPHPLYNGRRRLQRPASAPAVRQGIRNGSSSGSQQRTFNRVISTLERGDTMFSSAVASAPQVQHVVSSKGASLLVMKEHEIQWQSPGAFDILQQRCIDRAQWHIGRRYDLAKVAAQEEQRAEKNAEKIAAANKPSGQRCSDRTWRWCCHGKEIHKLLERCESIPAPLRGWKPTEFKVAKGRGRDESELIVPEPVEGSEIRYLPPKEVIADTAVTSAGDDLPSNDLYDEQPASGSELARRYEELLKMDNEEPSTILEVKEPEDEGFLLDELSQAEPLPEVSVDERRNLQSTNASEELFVGFTHSYAQLSSQHEPSPEELHQRVLEKYKQKQTEKHMELSALTASAVDRIPETSKVGSPTAREAFTTPTCPAMPSGLVADVGPKRSKDPVERLLVAINDFQQHTAEQLQRHPRGDRLPYSWVGGRADLAVSSASGQLVHLMTPDRTYAELERVKQCTEILKRFQCGNCADEEILEGLLGAAYVKPDAAEGLLSWGPTPESAKAKSMTSKDLDKFLSKAESRVSTKHNFGFDLRTTERPSSATAPKSQPTNAAPVRRRPQSAVAAGRQGPTQSGPGKSRPQSAQSESVKGLGADFLSLGLPEELLNRTGAKGCIAVDHRELPMRSRFEGK